jgi:signal transduction histidine kinase/CheY-like chemotaxis protein
MLGWSEAELLARPFAEIVDPADHAETTQVVARLAAGETVHDFVDHVLTQDGGTRTIMWTAVPDPGTDRFFIVGRDLTDQRRVEDALRQSQKMEAVGQLTGGLAHDFNNMLTVIRGSVDLLRRTDLSEERRGRYLNAIADTADRAAKLTSQLLAFARRSTLKPVAFDVARNVRGMEGMIGTLIGSRVRLAVDVEDCPCVVNADPAQFDTAIINMAVNARDAMQGEGALGITVKTVDAIPAVRAHPAIKGRFVMATVSDDGEGIQPDKIDQIFEPFFTTKRVGEGTGLGLSQVFGFAKQSGGEIQVSSSPGAGTTFALYLPRSDDEAVAADTGENHTLIDGADACVLVVEDNPEVGQFATQALAELGFKTSLAVDAEHALELLASTDGFEIVFSDVVMPGMSGIEMAREIQRLYPNIPVLLASGYSRKLAAGAANDLRVMQKPYSMEELSSALQGLLAEHGSAEKSAV